MTREIKFRAWEKAGKVMIDWLTITQTAFNDKSMDGFGLLYRVMTGKPAMDLMQFTGLKDKNGKEIYEGDIVRSSDWVYEIYAGKGFWGLKGIGRQGTKIYLKIWEERFTEVIGNIYENPELLK
jgi:uncharacterized phage protein (TIGR01671 family)